MDGKYATRWVAWAGVLVVSCFGFARDSAAQANAPATQPSRGNDPSLLGPSPGSGGRSDDSPGASGGIIGGRAGSSSPRLQQAPEPPTGVGDRPRPEVGIPNALPGVDLPIYGSLSLPSSEEEGPADGLTLDAAIETMIRSKKDLKARALEIPQARADVLTASLRANPILFADSQLVPYGSYSNRRPGGPVQYDVNLSIPFDVTGKRRARTDSAARAVRVLEAQYCDAVRRQIANLYATYVDGLAARETVRYSRAAVEGLSQIESVARSRLKANATTPGEFNRTLIQREVAAVELVQAEESLADALRTLGVLLDLPPATAEGIAIRGALNPRVDLAMDSARLVSSAIRARPDLQSFRLGIDRANSDVRLAVAERYPDVYVLAQPYTFQDNSPFNAKSSHSWAIGVTAPVPLFNRNQGNIQRARLNVTQSQLELAALERQVEAEVRRAERQYLVARNGVDRIEREMLPAAKQVLGEAIRLYQGGEAEFVAYVNARRDYNEAVRLYLDKLIRLRRSMLNLNTAVGERILP